MESALIVSDTEKSIALLESFLNQNAFQEIISARNLGEARRFLTYREFDLCLINAPLKDGFGTEFALDTAGEGIMQVLLIVKSELYEEVAAKVEDAGVFTISRPISRPLFWSALKLMNASFRRLKGLKTQNINLQQKISDIRTIDRAKCLLIQYLNMTEEQAHKYIEKQAMDMRLTKKEVAWSILKTYEN